MNIIIDDIKNSNDIKNDKNIKNNLIYYTDKLNIDNILKYNNIDDLIIIGPNLQDISKLNQFNLQTSKLNQFNLKSLKIIYSDYIKKDGTVLNVFELENINRTCKYHNFCNIDCNVQELEVINCVITNIPDVKKLKLLYVTVNADITKLNNLTNLYLCCSTNLFKAKNNDTTNISKQLPPNVDTLELVDMIICNKIEINSNKLLKLTFQGICCYEDVIINCCNLVELNVSWTYFKNITINCKNLKKLVMNYSVNIYMYGDLNLDKLTLYCSIINAHNSSVPKNGSIYDFKKDFETEFKPDFETDFKPDFKPDFKMNIVTKLFDYQQSFIKNVDNFEFNKVFVDNIDIVPLKYVHKSCVVTCLQCDRNNHIIDVGLNNMIDELVEYHKNFLELVCSSNLPEYILNKNLLEHSKKCLLKNINKTHIALNYPFNDILIAIFSFTDACSIINSSVRSDCIIDIIKCIFKSVLEKYPQFFVKKSSTCRLNEILSLRGKISKYEIETMLYNENIIVREEYKMMIDNYYNSIKSG